MLSKFLFVVEVIEAVVLATVLSVFVVWFLATQALALSRRYPETIGSLVPVLVGMAYVLILFSIAFYVVWTTGC